MENTDILKKVTIENLPNQRDAFGRFHGGDNRGTVAVVNSKSDIQQIEYVEFTQNGVKRGFHYHSEYQEKFYVLKGKIQMHLIDVDSPKQELYSQIITEGTLVSMSAKIAHAFISIEPSTALCFGSGPSPFEDMTRFNFPIN